eukprot:g66630.t1
MERTDGALLAMVQLCFLATKVFSSFHYILPCLCESCTRSLAYPTPFEICGHAQRVPCAMSRPAPSAARVIPRDHVAP